MSSPSPLLLDTYYHIYNRGTNGENIFIQERNYTHFLTLCTKYIEPVADIFAYCLLRNHFHLLVRIKSENEICQTLKIWVANQVDFESRDQQNGASDQAKKYLRSFHPSKRFSDFFNSYAKAINAAYGRTGSLFHHPFGRVRITNEMQLVRVVTYIHQNPQKHGFVDDFRDWKFSSYGTILVQRPTQIRRDKVLTWFSGLESYRDIHNHKITEQQCHDFAADDMD